MANTSFESGSRGESESFEYDLSDPRILEIMARNRDLLSGGSERPTKKQIAFALALGIGAAEIQGRSKTELIQAIDLLKRDKKEEKQSSVEKLAQNYLRRLIAPDDPLQNIQELSHAEVLAEIERRERALCEKFPVGSRISIKVNGSWGIISNYVRMQSAKIRMPVLVFFLKGEAQHPHSIAELNSVTHQGSIDTSAAGIEELRARIRALAYNHLKNYPVDISRVLGPTVTAVVNTLKNRDLSTISDKAIQDAIEDQRGIKY